MNEQQLWRKHAHDRDNQHIRSLALHSIEALPFPSQADSSNDPNNPSNTTRETGGTSDESENKTQKKSNLEAEKFLEELARKHQSLDLQFSHRKIVFDSHSKYG